jgi:hypothetical protein
MSIVGHDDDVDTVDDDNEDDDDDGGGISMVSVNQKVPQISSILSATKS